MAPIHNPADETSPARVPSLLELAALLGKATPGWWACCTEPNDDGSPYTWIGANAVGFSPVVADINDVNAAANGKANGRLIVAMKDALPALLNVASEAAFLLDRLQDFDNDSCNKTEQGENEWHGHVHPSFSRLSSLLRPLIAEPRSTASGTSKAEANPKSQANGDPIK